MAVVRVVMLSYWRDDAERDLEERAAHLLGKNAARWLWVVGDCSDDTLERLENVRAGNTAKDIHILHLDTMIEGSDPASRLKRLSATLTGGLAELRDDDDYVLYHCSDLQSPANLVERFRAHVEAGRDVIAGWPVLDSGGFEVFYDSWAYRKDGRHFTNQSPYHPVYHPREPFEVDSVGSCFMFPAERMVIERWEVYELSTKLREKGYHIWVDPTIRIVQPAHLWTVHSHCPTE